MLNAPGEDRDFTGKRDDVAGINRCEAKHYNFKRQTSLMLYRRVINWWDEETLH